MKREVKKIAAACMMAAVLIGRIPVEAFAVSGIGTEQIESTEMPESYRKEGTEKTEEKEEVCTEEAAGGEIVEENESTAILETETECEEITETETVAAETEREEATETETEVTETEREEMAETEKEETTETEQEEGTEIAELDETTETETAEAETEWEEIVEKEEKEEQKIEIELEEYTNLYKNGDITYQLGKNVKGVLSSDGTLTISGKGEMYDYKGNTASPLKSNNAIKKVVIQDGVTYIGIDTFLWCDAIKEVIIEKSVTCIGDYAFGRCKNLEKVELPDNLKRIERSAFYGCFNLREIKLPEGLEYIGADSFWGCVFIEEFYIPASVSEIEMPIFDACYNIMGEQKYALKNVCVSPKNVNYQSIDGVVYSKDGTEIVWYPGGRRDSSYTVCDSTIKVGNNALSNEFVQTIHLPETIKILGERAFSGALNLENINLPEKLEEINSCAFEACWKLKELVIPQSVTYIGYWAFAKCITLADIYIYNYNVYIQDCVQINDGTLSPYIFYRCQPDLRVHIYEGSTADDYMTGYEIGIKVYDLPHLYVIYFDSNGNCEGYMNSMICIYGHEYKLNANKFKRVDYVGFGKKPDSNYIFLGWNTKKDGSGKSYKNKAIVKNLTAEKDVVTLYAQWQKIEKCTVKFDVNGGKKLSKNSISVTKNKKIGELPKTTRKGYDFKGWYTKKDGGSRIDSTTIIKSNSTFYAQWKKRII